MKRCPSCKFIYLDGDEVCDFDGTQLVVVDERELESSAPLEAAPLLAPQPFTGKSSRAVALAAIVGLGLAVVMFLVYLAAARRSQPVAQNAPPPIQVATPSQPESSPTSTPSPSPSPSVAASPTATERRTDSTSAGSIRASVSRNPVSTSTQTGSQNRTLIRLSNGARIEADEVWRTKDGVWYRRNGLVTLLKPGNVKAIEKSSPRQ